MNVYLELFGIFAFYILCHVVVIILSLSVLGDLVVVLKEIEDNENAGQTTSPRSLAEFNAFYGSWIAYTFYTPVAFLLTTKKQWESGWLEPTYFLAICTASYILLLITLRRPLAKCVRALFCEPVCDVEDVEKAPISGDNLRNDCKGDYHTTCGSGSV
ncbi:hypothetical protein LTR56_000028 [Elasticomyces elasticus]|nr:hypothetical protein LTR22_016379 [Elasticomyces elasticus]KAK3661542.1 hypothetical protein LTR56_000028 [Elasticomyces elasticus]KAK4932793.1 hypothetical protein LTR49_000747 [Elasticomyces elasticus]KAK5758238.1 hypothetical protein LTS12_011708 [Elasticomyces elasticus]